MTIYKSSFHQLTRGRWVSSPGFFCILLMVSIGASYWPALNGVFVWDDPIIICNNPLVTTKEGIFGIWFSFKNIEYLPLTYSLFWLEWMCWGGWSPGWHGVNILLHLINAMMIWHILVSLKVPGARLASMIFALHPVNVASVGWISEEKNTLSMAFLCGAVILFLRKDGPVKKTSDVLPISFFTMALLSKTSAVVFPPLMLLTAWWKRGEVRISDIKRMTPYFLLSTLVGFVGIWSQHNVIKGREIFMGDLLWRAGIAGQEWWFYLFKILVPAHLSMLYPQWQIACPSPLFLAPTLLMLVVLAMGWHLRKKWGRSILFGIGFFTIAILPVLGFVKMYYFSLSRVADQWLYLPAIGIIALFSAGFVILMKRSSLEKPGMMAAIIICMGLGWMTYERARIFHDPTTFWSDVLSKDPNSYSALINLGCLSQSENVSAARSLFLKASEVRRDGVEALFSLGACEIDLGMFSDAAAHLQNGIKITRFDPQSHYMLGIVYQNLGRTREAIAEFLETLKLNGRFTKALTKLAASYLKTGDVTRAMICLQEAMKTEVNQAETHDLLGQIDELSGNVVHAREEYHKALEIDPDFSHSRERLEEVK